MWLSLLMAVLAFITSKASGASDKKALAIAAGVGGATYLATEYTDWGRDLSRDFDQALGLQSTDKTPPRSVTTEKEVVTGYNPDGTPIFSKVPVVATQGAQTKPQGGFWSGLTGLWDTLSPGAQIAVGAGVGVGAGSFLSKYGLLIALGIGAYVILK